MLLQFRFSNFRSFKEEAILDMEATNIKEHRYSLIHKNGVSILPVAAVYGANASGKSSFFMAMDRMKSIVVRRNLAQGSVDEQKEISFTTPFIFDESSKQTPTGYEVSLVIDEYKYRYGFACTDDVILSEYLYKQKMSKNKTIEKLIFDKNGKTIEIGKNINKSMRDEIEYCFSMSTDKILLITDIGLRNKEKELCSIFQWFSGLFIFLNNLQEPLSDGKFCEKFLGEFFVDVDNNIAKLQIKEELKSFIHEIDPSISDIVPSTMLKADGTEYTVVKAQHTLNGKNYEVPLSIESEGTNKTMVIALIVLMSVQVGSPIFFDELDSKLHPLLLRRILQMFTNKDINKSGAQLIFSAHNIINLNSSDLRRDEIWFVEKENHMSTIYSLVDFEDDEGGIRSDLNYGKHYLSGRFGAVPFQEV